LLNPKQNSGSVKIDGKYYFVKIKAKLPVFVAKKVIYKNSPIAPYAVKKEVDFKFFYSKPLENVSEDLVASKIISKNAIINTSNTKQKPLVMKNKKITVEIKSQNITITSPAIALKDGNMGDIIPIEMNKKILKAKVIAPGLVTIE